MRKHKSPPLWFLRIWKPIHYFKLSAAACLPGGLYTRFVILPHWSKRAVERGRYAKATKFARELVDLAQRFPTSWNYGNAIHHSHLVLGRVALADGNLETARAELLAAGRTPGSPQLSSFGPNMRLAKDLLAAGESAAVLEYFDLCRAFWKMDRQRLDLWTADVAEGRIPKFGPNLVY